jgi:ABC-2 type transport system permease protein
MALMAHRRTLYLSAWLGWQVESNWATPWLFALHVFAKPLGGSFVLVCMYWAAQAANDRVPSDFLPFLYISSACFMLVGGVTLGMSQAVVTDRESYGMLKFVRISPATLGTYLVGRGLSRGSQACAGALFTVAVGLVFFPEVRSAFRGHAID